MTAYTLSPAILLVDDDRVDVINVRRMVQRHGYSGPLYVAGNGEEALRRLRTGEPTLEPGRTVILLDINMPRMNGFEFLAELRADPALHRHTVIAVTSSDDPDDVRRADDLSVTAYLIKPITYEAFTSALGETGMEGGLRELP